MPAAKKADASLAFVDEQQGPHLERLLRLIKQPSVSPTGEGVRDCAVGLAKMFDEGTYREVGQEPEILPLIAGSAPFYWFTDFLNAPVAAGGMGHGGRMHAPDEYVVYEDNAELAGMADATKCYIRFQNRFAGA